VCLTSLELKWVCLTSRTNNVSLTSLELKWVCLTSRTNNVCLTSLELIWVCLTSRTKIPHHTIPDQPLLASSTKSCKTRLRKMLDSINRFAMFDINLFTSQCNSVIFSTNVEDMFGLHPVYFDKQTKLKKGINFKSAVWAD